jgi:hypothetical protein
LKVLPQDGGCWYCHTDFEPLEFTCEFDANVHRRCVIEALEQNPNDIEAQIIANELQIKL